MIKFNDKMKQKLANTTLHSLHLPAGLMEIIEQGFIEKEDSILSKKLSEANSTLSSYDFEDSTAYECFVNSLHIDDYVEELFLEYSIAFSNNLLNKWDSKKTNTKINVIITLDDLGGVVKFYLTRKGKSWLEDDLTQYTQPLLITDEQITFSSE